MCPESALGVRIGELSRRAGVSAQLLRAWEQRYGLLQPSRSAGGYRLYAASDEDRVHRMQAHLARGLSAAEAAQAVLGEERAPRTERAPREERAESSSLREAASAMARGLESFDEPAAHAALDRLLADFTVESVLRQVILPYLHDLGERWAQGEVGVAREHFASNVLRGRLLGLARGWGDGRGPLAILACPSGEQHDLGLLAFGVVLHRNGWRVNYLGADVPLDDLAQAAEETRPDLTVLAAVRPELYQGQAADLARLAAMAPLGVAGAGATEALAAAVGARLLAADPVTEAKRLDLV